LSRSSSKLYQSLPVAVTPLRMTRGDDVTWDGWLLVTVLLTVLWVAVAVGLATIFRSR
jgi:hypothetical protein